MLVDLDKFISSILLPVGMIGPKGLLVFPLFLEIRDRVVASGVLERVLL